MNYLKYEDAQKEDAVDVAIIGAGVSGLYCAYRMMNSKEFEGKKIAIYDRLNRTGGRLQSDLIPIVANKDPNADTDGTVNFFESVEVDWVKEEQGGMRFNYDMTELMTLIAELDLCDQIVPFPMSSAGNTNMFNVRGCSFSVADAAESNQMIWSELYHLNPEEIGLSPTQIVTNAYNRILQANNVLMPEEQSPEYWQHFRLHYKWDGIPMNEWLIGGLLMNMGHSAECVEMLSNTIGFEGPFKGLPNAGDAWQILADFPKDPTYYTFKYGFSTLPDKIIEKLEGKVDIFLGTNVDQILGKDGNFEVHLTEAPKGQSAGGGDVPGSEHKVLKAKQIISAIASTGFKSLFVKSPALNKPSAGNDPAKLWKNINGVLGMNLMKINFYFKEAWWNNQSLGRPVIEFGPNFTDMPINSIYPFYSVNDLEVNKEGTEVSIDSGNDPAALTLYCDYNNTNFWKGLQNVEPKFTSPLQEIYNEKENQTVFAASQAVVKEARAQMGRLFGVTNIPEPVFTSYRLWNGEDDFEHAYHQWQLNVNDKDVIAYLSNPMPGIYMCNEAISDMQGWVNGSLRSSNLALGKISQEGIQPLSNRPCKSPSAPNQRLKGSAKPTLRIKSGLWG